MIMFSVCYFKFLISSSLVFNFNNCGSLFKFGYVLIYYLENCFSNKSIATCSFKILCLCNVSRDGFFVILFSSFVNFDCLNISGFVKDSNNINDRS